MLPGKSLKFGRRLRDLEFDWQTRRLAIGEHGLIKRIYRNFAGRYLLFPRVYGDAIIFNRANLPIFDLPKEVRKLEKGFDYKRLVARRNS